MAGFLAFAFAFALGFAPSALAHSYKFGDITVGHVWAPPPENGASGIAVYGPILNSGDTAIRLVGASTPIGEEVRFRISKNGTDSWPEFIELQPGKALALAPWREHIWISSLNRPLKDGNSFDLLLDFGDKGKHEVKVVVEGPAGD